MADQYDYYSMTPDRQQVIIDSTLKALGITKPATYSEEEFYNQYKPGLGEWTNPIYSDLGYFNKPAKDEYYLNPFSYQEVKAGSSSSYNPFSNPTGYTTDEEGTTSSPYSQFQNVYNKYVNATKANAPSDWQSILDAFATDSGVTKAGANANVYNRYEDSGIPMEAFNKFYVPFLQENAPMGTWPYQSKMNVNAIPQDLGRNYDLSKKWMDMTRSSEKASDWEKTIMPYLGAAYMAAITYGIGSALAAPAAAGASAVGSGGLGAAASAAPTLGSGALGAAAASAPTLGTGALGSAALAAGGGLGSVTGGGLTGLLASAPAWQAPLTYGALGAVLGGSRGGTDLSDALKGALMGGISGALGSQLVEGASELGGNAAPTFESSLMPSGIDYSQGLSTAAMTEDEMKMAALLYKKGLISQPVAGMERYIENVSNTMPTLGIPGTPGIPDTTTDQPKPQSKTIFEKMQEFGTNTAKKMAVDTLQDSLKGLMNKGGSTEGQAVRYFSQATEQPEEAVASQVTPQANSYTSSLVPAQAMMQQSTAYTPSYEDTSTSTGRATAYDAAQVGDVLSKLVGARNRYGADTGTGRASRINQYLRNIRSFM